MYLLPTELNKDTWAGQVARVARREMHASFRWRKRTFGGPRGRWCRCQWPRGLRRRSATARLLRLWFRIPLGVWMYVCCECCVLSGRGLCDGLITRPEESYRLWCVVVCDLESLWMRRSWPTGGLLRQIKVYMVGNIKMNLKDIELGGLDWINLVNNRRERRAVLNTVMNSR